MPATLTTQRLLLRPPQATDAAAIFNTYANALDVTRYVGWERHTTLTDTQTFISFSEQEWSKWHTGPLVITLRETGNIIGSTGLSMITPYRASTGYVLAQSAWGNGYASEALTALIEQAQQLPLWRIEALCHHAHHRSARVLEKSGFEQEGQLQRHTIFPNLDPNTPQDVLLYARILR